MKLQCNKCNKQLTTDLYPVKVKYKSMLPYYNKILNLKDIFVKEREVYEDMNGKEYVEYNFTSMKGGIFYMSKPKPMWNNKWDEERPAQIVRATKNMLVVGESSILEGIVPPYYTGCGCCNHSMGEELTCECGNTLGKMYLDCHEDKTVYFYPKAVRRYYNKG